MVSLTILKPRSRFLSSLESITSIPARSFEKVAGVKKVAEMRNNHNHHIAYGTEEVIDTKTIILKSIDEVPGIRYRELLRLTGLTNGALEYNLRMLERTQKVKVDRQDGKRARYYSTRLQSRESCILGHTRNVSSRQIVL